MRSRNVACSALRRFVPILVCCLTWILFLDAIVAEGYRDINCGSPTWGAYLTAVPELGLFLWLIDVGLMTVGCTLELCYANNMGIIMLRLAALCSIVVAILSALGAPADAHTLGIVPPALFYILCGLAQLLVAWLCRKVELR